MNLWSNNRSLRLVFMIMERKEFYLQKLFSVYTSIWGHIISKEKSLVNTTNKA